MSPTRRLVLAAPALAAPAWIALRRPAWATPQRLAEAIRAFTGGAELRPGRVRLEVPPLVENGNTVPLSVSVESPMSAADHVRAIAVFNELNPQPQVIIAQLGPRAGRGFLATHIRLATSQQLVAVAQLSDGDFWSDRAQVVVTLAACVES